VHQASRRTWRLGQTEPVKVYFPIYRNAMEHRAVARVGQKLVAAQTLYGNDIAGGLVSQPHGSSPGSFLHASEESNSRPASMRRIGVDVCIIVDGFLIVNRSFWYGAVVFDLCR